MEMAKPDNDDIEAAGKLMSVIESLSQRFGPCLSDIPGQDDIENFDPDNSKHLRALYDKLESIWESSPGFAGRVIGGMCYVILYDKNQIIDPDADTIKLHPRIIRALEIAKQGEQPEQT